ncbi:hypothetical protein [Prosthecobacter fluviatilis]|uniref:Zinc ribbon domain-containing protein n=1 Tax=Prosthecobacter fluviatilis TaxID=445931 RepID=A0ABW0KQ32_9BACT
MSESSNESKTTRKIRGKSHFHGGLESTLDTTGYIVMTLGVLMAAVLVIKARAAAIFPALGLLVLSWLCRVILRALAEHLRLQKKAQGLPYDGQISEALETVTYTCSECGAMLHSDTRCEACGRAIEPSA